MTNFFDAFSASTKAEWEAQFLADLKGQDLSPLRMHDEVEDIAFSAYYHPEDRPDVGKIPVGKRDFSDSNSWKNGCLITIDDEKSANSLALERLNAGVNLLVFKSQKADVNWSRVLEQIELQYIETQFVLHTLSEYRSLRATLELSSHNVHFNLDFFDEALSWEDFKIIANDFRTEQMPFCSVNSFKIQQCGANGAQEIGFALAAGHEYLQRLMALGMSVDEAAACISFKIGVGAKYVFEIAKFRALHQAWAQVIDAYKPVHACTRNCRITAVLGHLNKSLADPYTNLLRQTTEAMSAIIGGIDGIVILPYDYYSNNPAELAARMAINISSIVQEESFLDKVCDPLGGSYSQEALTQLVGEKGWRFFQDIENAGGLAHADAHALIYEVVSHTRHIRVQRLQEGKDLLIGITKYPNPEARSERWSALPTYFGIQYLVLEEALKSAQVS